VIHAALLQVALLVPPPVQDAAQPIDFARDVQPILERACLKCHGPEKQKGGLRFDLRDSALNPADSGAPAIAPGKADDSELIQRVEAQDAEIRMPLKSEPLSVGEIKTLRAWIDGGAHWPTTPAHVSGRNEMIVTDADRQHWSYRPLRGLDPPQVRDPAWCRTPIDRFILAALDARGMHPNPPAERRTLIRRVHFDLLGLPPTPEEVNAFIADPALDAYEKLIERLLASPRYGERWGRHWLDVARYADSDGLESDADRPTAYRYRDFVIQAINDDLSYQTFVRWQIAGDEYEPDNPSALVGTGFIAAALTEVLTVPMEEEKLRFRFNELDDMAVTTVSAFLGLTLGCARCHDHKYDAIPTRDYYRLQCAFTTTMRDEVLLTTRANADAHREQTSRWQTRLKDAQHGLDSWLNDQKKAKTAALRSARIDALPISGEDKAVLKDQPESEAGKELAKRHEKELAISEDDYRNAFTDEQRREWDRLSNDAELIKRSEPLKPPTALAIVDKQATPEPTWLLARGSFYAKQEPLKLGFLSVLTGSKSADQYFSDARHQIAPGRSTGQRRALADWITDDEQGGGALLARVMVNRVWQHHFGEGLVRTVSDFGVRGEAPTHPELLESLTHRFVAEGWHLKRLHRLILNSAAYMQDASYDAERAQLDPENRLLWRRRPQRLEAECLRDTVLAVSGTLNQQAFGPAYKAPIPPEAMLARNTKDPYPKDLRDNESTHRRTVYMFHKRVVQHPFLQAFDGPEAAVSCGRRGITTVAPQALVLLNDSFLRNRATDLARRMLIEAGTAPDHCVIRGFELTLARPPSDTELAAAVQFIQTQEQRRAARDQALAPDEHRVRALADYAQALFGLNEFIYVD
jgi:hypothetical protein